MTMPRGTGWPYPPLMAHRGGGALAPENTLAGFRAAVRYGFSAAECDVKLSADQVCVLMHDDTLERTSSGHGALAQQPMAGLAELDAGSWLGAEFAGEPIPTLANVAAYCRANQLLLNIELKPGPGQEAMTGRLVAQAAARIWTGSEVPPLLSSFSRVALLAAATAAPDLPRAWLTEAVPDDWASVLEQLGAVALHVDGQFLTRPQASAIKAAGYGLLCYTVNDLASAQRLYQWGVDCLCTDRLDWPLAIRR